MNPPHPPPCLRVVTFLRPLLWLALCLLPSAFIRAESPPLPFMLAEAEGPWRLVPTDRYLASGHHLVAIMTPRVGPIRLLAFHDAPAKPEAPAAFAEKLRSALISEPAINPQNAPDRRLGYAGHLLSFQSEHEGIRFACELFVFTNETGRWALLQITPHTAEEPPPFTALQPAKPVPAGAVALAPFRVHENPVTSFPLSLRVQRNPQTDRIERIFVTEVPADSSTDLAGVKVGDEVLSLDRRSVKAFAGGLGRRSELGQILIDRRPGTRVEFELLTPGDAKPRHITLTAGQPANSLRL